MQKSFPMERVMIMSNSSLAKVKVPANTANYTKGRNYKISKITVHHMAGILTAKECGKVFQARNRGASAHYGIGKDGKIGLYVDEKNAAWADANRTSNHKSVTIEVANSERGGQWPVSKKSLELLIKLVADIAKRNDLGKLVAGKNLTWHSMYANTTCCGNYLRSQMKYIAQEANKLNGYGTTKKTTSTKKTYTGTFPTLPKRGYFKKGDTGTQVKYLQKFLNWYGDYGLTVDGDFGAKTDVAVEKFQKAEGLTVDGLFGSKCLAKAKTVKK